jgi:hypothetical protein
MLPGRLNRRTNLLITPSLTTLLLYIYTHFTQPPKRPFQPKTTLPCAHLPGADDTVVILKTGSTELPSKLPIHLKTTLNCYPHHLIFSDHASQHNNEVKILDALAPVSEIFKTSHQDFALYRQLQKSGRQTLHPPSDPIGDSQEEKEDGTSILGKPLNPAWVLDKYKFLPMLATTLHQFPSKSWYIFLELDSFVFWSTLLLSLAALSSTEKHYIGAQVEIDDTIFAHGGSGFAISRAALRAAVELYEGSKEEWEAVTAGHWAGDAVLGKLLAESGTSLTWGWPIWQGGDVGNMSYGGVEYGKRLWCYPTVSYHHLGVEAIASLWEFEQGWIAREGNANGRVLRHQDVFREFVIPRTGEVRVGWDNHADGDRGVVATLEECRGICETEAECLQYALHREGKCLVTGRPNLGEAAIGIQSGWIQERMQAFYDTAAPCEDEEGIL